MYLFIALYLLCMTSIAFIWCRINKTKNVMKLLLTSSSFKGGGIASYAVELINSYAESYEICILIGDDSLYPLDKYNVKVYHYDMADTSEKNASEVLVLINQKIKQKIVIKLISI